MSLNRYFVALQEKLKASDSVSDWISDFKKSDAPQFVGKSEEKRRQMAIAAKLGAERGPKNEASVINSLTKGRIKMADDMGEPSYAARKKAAQTQQQIVDKKYINKVADGAKGGIKTNTGVTAEETYSDTGWKKPQTSAKTKNVAQNLARKAMKQSEKEAKKEKGFGPSPADKLSIRKEDVEELDELKKSTLGSYVKKAQQNKSFYAADIGRMASSGDTSSSSYNNVKRQHKNRGVGIDRAVDRLTKEEVDLEEGKYGAFRLGPGVGRFSSRGRAQHQGLEDPRTGLPLGFSNPPKKDEPKKDEPKKVKEEVEHMTENVFYNSGESANKKPVGKGTIVKNTRTGIVGKAHSWSVVQGVPHLHVKSDNDSYHSPTKDWQVIDKKKGMAEDVELDELDQSTLTKYATRAKFSSDPKRREGAAKAQEKINKKSKDIQKEEAEQVDEAIRHEIAGQVGRFIGNKIDPVHGDIMHAHGKEAYRQAAYHIRKTVKDVSDAVSSLHDKLHQHLRTGKLQTEEVEELEESHFKVGDKVKCKASGMKGEVVKLDKEEGGDTEKYYTVKREDGTTKKMAPKDMTKINEETDQIDEISAGLAKSVAQRRDQDFRKMTPTETQKRRMGRGDWRADPSLQADKAYKSAVKRGAKDVYGYNEETDLEEAGKLQGGAKDPCWAGYKMVGTKKKGGREVPNCVPREGKEYKKFKALKEELNGNSNRS